MRKLLLTSIAALFVATGAAHATERLGAIMRLILTVAMLYCTTLVCTTVGYAQVFYATGMGNKSCGQYLSAVHNHPPGKHRLAELQEGKFFDEHALYSEWLAGFISASNYWIVRAGTGNSVKADYAATDVWVRKWCEQNPTKKVLEAAIAFLLEQNRQ
jgi:hypothetical protein